MMPGDSYEAARFSGTGHVQVERIGRALAQAGLVPIALRLAKDAATVGVHYGHHQAAAKSFITSTGGTAFPVQAELDTLKGVYAL